MNETTERLIMMGRYHEWLRANGLQDTVTNFNRYLAATER